MRHVAWRAEYPDRLLLFLSVRMGDGSADVSLSADQRRSLPEQFRAKLKRFTCLNKEGEHLY